MAILAIEGHPKRGNEVIGILEMLGGKNSSNFNGASSMYYLIGIIEPKILCTIKSELDNSYEQFTYFTLEEFLEKFPYKVGDKVNYVKYNDEYPSVYTIQKMWWNGVTIEYLLDSSGFSALTKDLQPYEEENYCQVIGIGNDTSSNGINTSASLINEETMEEKEPEPKAPILSNRYDYAEGKCGYVIPNGYEFDSIKQGFQTEIILRPIKSQYPKTYKECCDILDIYPIYNKPNLCICEWHPETREMHEHYSKLANLSQKDIAFMILRICRDAYWKIAGDWKPDWENGLSKFCIAICENRIIKSDFASTNFTLAFPTAEMRDAFYENFKDLIEQCKELL